MQADFSYTVKAVHDDEQSRQARFGGLLWLLCLTPFFILIFWLAGGIDGQDFQSRFPMPELIFIFLMIAVFFGGMFFAAIMAFHANKYLEKLGSPIYNALDTISLVPGGLQFKKRGFFKWEDMQGISESYFHDGSEPSGLHISFAGRKKLRVTARHTGQRPKPEAFREFIEDIYLLAPQLKPDELVQPAPWTATDDAIIIDSYSYMLRHIRSVEVREELLVPNVPLTGFQFHFSLRYWDQTPPPPRTLPPLQSRALVRRLKQLPDVPLTWKFYHWGGD